MNWFDLSDTFADRKKIFKQTSYNKKRLHNIQFQYNFIEYSRDNQISLHLNQQCSC